MTLRETIPARWIGCVAAGLASAMLALAPVTIGAAAGSDVPIDLYPVAAPSPVGDSRPPSFVDEDETVRAQLSPEGQVVGLVDDAILKLRGSGDYVLFLPARVTRVNDLRGDIPPGLQGGRVSFLGNIVGQSQVGAEATLDLSVAKTMPLRVHLAYLARGRAVSAAEIPRSQGPITVLVELTNLTAASRQFTRGDASPSSLAPVLDDLRQAAAIYTPETDLQAQLPLPPSLRVGPPVTAVEHDVYVPLALTVSAHLMPGASVVDAGGSAVLDDPRGARLTWTEHLPVSPGAAGAGRTFSFTYSVAHPRLPALDIRADPLPFGGAMFTPPDGGTWARYLTRVPDRSDYVLLAQEGAASLHRIGELVQPLGRPGPGPVKVKYDFVLDAGAAPPAVVPAIRVHGQPWAIGLAIILGGFVLLNAAWAWARH